jgi:1-acyl-sn-glycerol-3-phosphate acyltransferase
MIRKALGTSALRAARWRLEGTPPPPDHVGILLAAPHTSNLDFPLMLATAWATELHVRYLAKRELFRPPLGTLMRRTGGIPVDRENPGTLIEDLTARARLGQGFVLVLAPEGTRQKSVGWRSGFYRLATAAEIPVTACSVDRATRLICFGPTFHLTGDVAADMDRLRAFYADKHGVRPDLASPVRLSDDYRAGATQQSVDESVA